MKKVIMVRIYLSENKAHLTQILHYLHDENPVRGVTVFRGITGFGHSGKMHSANLLDLSLDLPVVLEFFDVPEKVDTVLAYLNDLIAPGHIVCWDAYVNE